MARTGYHIQPPSPLTRELRYNNQLLGTGLNLSPQANPDPTRGATKKRGPKARRRFSERSEEKCRKTNAHSIGPHSSLFPGIYTLRPPSAASLDGATRSAARCHSTVIAEDTIWLRMTGVVTTRSGHPLHRPLSPLLSSQFAKRCKLQKCPPATTSFTSKLLSYPPTIPSPR